MIDTTNLRQQADDLNQRATNMPTFLSAIALGLKQKAEQLAQALPPQERLAAALKLSSPTEGFEHPRKAKAIQDAKQKVLKHLATNLDRYLQARAVKVADIPGGQVERCRDFLQATVSLYRALYETLPTLMMGKEAKGEAALIIINIEDLLQSSKYGRLSLCLRMGQ